MTRLFDCDDNGKPWSEYDREDEAHEEAAFEAAQAADEDDDGYCHSCAGTGEGYADSACGACRGRGFFGRPL